MDDPPNNVAIRIDQPEDVFVFKLPEYYDPNPDDEIDLSVTGIKSSFMKFHKD
jgi:hypothetical protein